LPRSPRSATTSEKLRALVLAPAPEQVKPRRTPAELRQILDDLGVRSGESYRPPAPKPEEEEEVKPRPTMAELRARLDATGLLRERHFDLHGSGEITGKCIDPRPEDLILHLPKGSRTRQQCIEVLHHPKTVAKCKWAKAQKKDKRRVEKCTERKRYEMSIEATGGTVGKECRRRAHYCIPAYDVTRRSQSRREYNANCAYFRFLLKLPPTAHLPPPSIEGVFRKGAESLAYHFTLGQLLPTVDLVYTETSLNVIRKSPAPGRGS